MSECLSNCFLTMKVDGKKWYNVMKNEENTGKSVFA